MEIAKREYEKPEMRIFAGGGYKILTLSKDNDALDKDWTTDLI